jgi:hypothetical protein
VKADIFAAGSFTVSSAKALPGEITARLEARNKIISVFVKLILIAESSLNQVISKK